MASQEFGIMEAAGNRRQARRSAILAATRIGRKKKASAAALPIFKPRNLDRYPRLDTIIMVERALYASKGGKTVTEIWKGLKKQIMWTTFTTIIDYLEYSGKIHLEGDKTVTWLWNPKLLEHVRKKGVEIA